MLVALIRTDLPAYSRLFIGWFGPRGGIGTVVLALLVIERGGEIQHPDVLAQAGGVIAVTLSLIVHSISAPLGIRRYGSVGSAPPAAP